MKNSDKPAFPILNEKGYPRIANNLYSNEKKNQETTGFSKREIVAMSFLQGMFANPTTFNLPMSDPQMESKAVEALNYADIFLKISEIPFK